MDEDELADTVLAQQETTTVDDVMRMVAATPRIRPRAMWVGDHLGDRYMLEAFLGEGGMGTVYQALDEKLDERVALKLVRGHHDGQILRDEVKLAQKVTHPNVCRTFDLEEANGVQFVKMELVAGATLQARLEAKQQIPLGEVVQIGRQIAAGLAAAHARQIAHNDLKPANVMLDGERVVLMDFGIASLADSPTEGVHGTLGYIAPERWNGGGDTRSDLYALGCVIYEMLVGEHFVPAAIAIDQMVEFLAKPAPDVRAKRPETPRWLARAVSELLAIDPAQRVHGAALLMCGPKSRARIVVPIAFVLAAVAGALAGPLTRRPAWTPAMAAYPEFTENVDAMSISPDNRWIVYASTRGVSGTQRAWVMPREPGDTDEAYELVTPEGEVGMPQFTPDGHAILYLLVRGESQEFYLQPVGGHPLQAIGPPQLQPFGRLCGVGRISAQFGATQPLVYRPPVGAAEVLYTPPQNSTLLIQGCNRAGDRVLVVETAGYERTGKLMIIERDSKRVVPVLRDRRTGAAAWSHDEKSLVVARSLETTSQLWEVFFDGRSARRLINDEGPDLSPSVSSDGAYLAFTHDLTTFIPYLMDDGVRRPLTTAQVQVFYPRPIDNDSAVVELAPNHGAKVAVLRLASGTSRPIAEGSAPFPSLDGRTIYFIDPVDPYVLSSVPTTGGTPHREVRLPGELAYGNAGPDGLHVLVTIGTDTFGYRITPSHEVILESTGLVSVARDGGWRAVTHLTKQRVALVAPGHALSDPAFEIATKSVHHPFLDATHLSYCNDGNCYVLDVLANSSRHVGEVDLEPNAAVMPDGKRVLFSEMNSRATKYLVTNFATRPN